MMHARSRRRFLSPSCNFSTQRAISSKARLTALALALTFGIVGLASSGCAVNPATGNRQVMLISEQQEIAMGREADGQIVASMGLYNDPEIQEYVNGLGQDLAAKSERPDLDWEFKVIDDPIVNAFALPGGYIYITRGILTHLNSEAELAAVLGHEIGHVTARHSANQMSKQQLASIGLVVGAIAAGEEYAGLAQLAGVGLQLMTLKFSRDDERQADDLGLRYIDRVGYDPRPMTDVFTTLGRVSAAQGAGRMPGWMATHPAPENRVARLSKGIQEIGVDFSGRPINQSAFYAQLDNMVFGEDPREGYFIGNAFYHPTLKMQLVFPEGWETQNTRTQVAAISPDKDALMVMTLAQEQSPQAAEGKFFEQQGVVRGTRWKPSLKGLSALGANFATEATSNKVRGKVAFVEYGENVYRLLTYTPDSKWSGYGAKLESAVETFKPLNEASKINVKPQRVNIVKLPSAMSLEDFDRKYPSSVDLETLAIVNHVQPGHSFAAGDSVKRVSGGVKGR